MASFETKRLPDRPDVVAPDGASVRVLLSLEGGSMAHFELAPGLVSAAVAHKTIEEIWYFLSGKGVMWRREGDHEQVVEVEPGICVSIPRGTSFQFRADGTEALRAVAITMPPWPGEGEAISVDGAWEPKLGAS